MKNIIQGIKAILQRNSADNDNDANLSESEVKLTQILQGA